MENSMNNNHSDTKHMFIMALACILPLALIFLLPFFGISGAWVNTGAIALMVFLHLFMMKDHLFCNKGNKGGAK